MLDKFYIFTHHNLDGALSLLLFKWLNPYSTIFYKSVSNYEIYGELDKCIKNSVNPKNIVVVNFALRKEFLDFDKSFVKFIDHHEISLEYVDQFQNADLYHKNFSSNCRLMYQMIDKSITDKILTPSQKKLILYGDDYNSGIHKFPDAYNLNILYWIKYKNDINQFLTDFNDGFTENSFSKSDIKDIYRIKVDAAQKSLKYPLFKGTILFDGKTIETITSFGEYINNIVLDILVKKNSAPLFIFINTKTNKLIIRQKHSDDLFNLREFAQKYCEGDGNNLSAGGKINEFFIELTKNFQPL